VIKLTPILQNGARPFSSIEEKNIVKYRSQKYKIYCYRPFENENNAEMVILGL